MLLITKRKQTKNPKTQYTLGREESCGPRERKQKHKNS